MAVPRDLMDILACPKCKGDVEEKGMFILCKKCELAYPVLDEDVPDMLIEDAWPLEKARKNKFKHELKL
ncbi:MAG: Trm112 family protein [Candidatus Aenigmarchaeota archaeon]|nr:Trm112 family protein [Candidatus Aenigmarchaeota archaeon]